VEVLAAASALDDGDGRPVGDPDLLSLSLLHPAPGEAARVLRARRATSVEVLGAGRVGATVSTLLAAAGIGHLDIDDDGPLRTADVAPGGLRTAAGAAGTRGAQARRLLSAVTTQRNRPPQPPALSVLAPTTALLAPELL